MAETFAVAKAIQPMRNGHDLGTEGDPCSNPNSKQNFDKILYFDISAFSKTIFDFLIRVPVILLSDQGPSSSEHEITGDPKRSLRFFCENQCTALRIY